MIDDVYVMLMMMFDVCLMIVWVFVVYLFDDCVDMLLIVVID